MNSVQEVPFRVSARTARLIGRENVATAESAISELVKNSYDADASFCIIRISPTYDHVPEKISKDEFELLVGWGLNPENHYDLNGDLDDRSEAKDALEQFQAFMRSRDPNDAPALFNFSGGPLTGQPHPFELVQRFATGHKKRSREMSQISRDTRVIKALGRSIFLRLVFGVT